MLPSVVVISFPREHRTSPPPIPMRPPRLRLRTLVPIALSLALSGCRGERAEVTLAPPRLEDGWRVSTPAAVGMDSATLARGYAHMARDRELRTATSLLVVRDGILVAEGYFGEGARERLNDTRSVTKSVTALVLGIAIEEGEIRGVRQPLADFYPEHLGPGADPRKRAITLEDLLTMRSGLRWDEHANRDRHPLGMYRALDGIRYVLWFPAEEAPGTVFRYSTGNSQLISGVIRRGTGRTPAELARERIFAPLEIDSVRWATHADGNSYGGVRLWMTSRDMAKIGQLALQGGAWEGRRIVPARWMEMSTRAHAVSPEGPYGYHWWVRPRGFAAAGYGGQYVYVVPSERIVVVMTADPNTGRHIGFDALERLIDEYVVGAVRSAPGAGVGGSSSATP